MLLVLPKGVYTPYPSRHNFLSRSLNPSCNYLELSILIYILLLCIRYQLYTALLILRLCKPVFQALQQLLASRIAILIANTLINTLSCLD